MTIDEVNGIFVDLVTMYTNRICECDSYEVPNKNEAYMYIGTMIGLKEFRDAISNKIKIYAEQDKKSEKDYD